MLCILVYCCMFYNVAAMHINTTTIDYNQRLSIFTHTTRININSTTTSSTTFTSYYEDDFNILEFILVLLVLICILSMIFVLPHYCDDYRCKT